LGRPARAGFTLLEVLTVVIIIGILAALGYASLMDLIFTNRAKESAQIMRTFAERSIAEGKRQNRDVTITLLGNNITATIGDDPASARSSALSQSFTLSSATPAVTPLTNPFVNTAISVPRIGASGISGSGFFAACGARNYCAAAVKLDETNQFKAYIKRPSITAWQEVK
jgi:prepilin-type N-terminal cleavage/methylation domain-containing protein